jgi:hypothetical protein
VNKKNTFTHWFRYLAQAVYSIKNQHCATHKFLPCIP